MKRYTMQFSEDGGKTWTNGPREFTSLKSAREHFDKLEEIARTRNAPSVLAFEWRVGFLLKVRGATYRLFDTKKGEAVK